MTPPAAMPAATPAATPAAAMRRMVHFDPQNQGGGGVGAADFVFDAPGAESVASRCAGVILAAGDAARAEALLAAGARCVLLGQLALADSAAVERLASAGGGAVGVYAPLKRQAINWSFETRSNADFKTLAPSQGEAAWEVLAADGSPTGALALWWLRAMRDAGAQHFLARADIRDDTDLNLCSGLVEALGDALWIGPLDDPAPALEDWITWGRCRQIVLPAAGGACHAPQ